jgi:hypothetical protein
MQSAVSAQAKDVVGVHSDEDGAVDEVENGADNNNVVVEEELKDTDPQLQIRYSTCFGDMKKKCCAAGV